MTPKLKAKDLVNKFKTYADDNYADDKNPYYGQVLANKRIVLHNSAKQCALIAVDEILNNVYRTPFRFTSVSADELYRIEQECKHSLNMNILFLNSVKKEIEKL